MTIEELKQLQINKYRDRISNPSTHNEHDIQCAVMKYVKYQYPNIKYIAIPNGGKRSNSYGRYMKDEGLWPGCPDTLLLFCKNNYGGLWIEYKNGKKGVLSDYQKEALKYLDQHGYKTAVCRSFDEAKQVIDNYLS